MNLNWKVMGVVFVVTLIIVMLTGTYLPKGVGFLRPIIGGLIAGYLVGGNYIDGIVNGGISVGLAGLVYSTGILTMNANPINTSMNTLISNLSNLEFLMTVMVAGFLFYFVMGMVGGLMGFAIKERKIILGILR